VWGVGGGGCYIILTMNAVDLFHKNIFSSLFLYFFKDILHTALDLDEDDDFLLIGSREPCAVIAGPHSTR
jgi:hypothetical protein